MKEALYAFIGTYVLSILLDLVKSGTEVLINFFHRENRPTEYLDHKECAFVIPCHNSEGVIAETLRSIPYLYRTYCVANACSDNTIEEINRKKTSTIVTDRPGKIRAVILGALAAKRDGYTHFVLLDDDVKWPEDFFLVPVHDKSIPATALPVLPTAPETWIMCGQVIEYMYMVVSKRAQGFLGNTIMASGAAGIYRIDTFLEAMKQHDGEHVGDDLQSAHIHHGMDYRIDFLPQAIVRTHPPKTIAAWWTQRAKRWEVSPIYNAKWIIRTIFKRHSPGWWIRWVAMYRVAVFFNDLARVVTLPLVIMHFPGTLVGVWCIAYGCFMMKGLAYWVSYQDYRYKISWLFFCSILTYPAYSCLMWLSRLYAIPNGIKRNFLKKENLKNFIEKELSHV